MVKSSSLLQTKTFVIGSSSPLCAAINDDARVGEAYFFGRTNPFGFNNWVSTKSFTLASHIDEFERQFSTYLGHSIDSHTSHVNLIFVAGVSSNDWQESFIVNELLPSIISVSFISATKDVLAIENASICLIGSTGSYRGAKLPYSATKASLTGVMHSLNRDSPGIVRTNLVIPTAFNGGMISDWGEEKKDIVAKTNIVHRIGDIKEIADAIMFAASNQFVVDSVINMSAGQVNIE